MHDISEHLNIWFGEDCALHVSPKDSLGAMGLKYFQTVLHTHGARAVEIHTEIDHTHKDPNNPKPHGY